MELNPTIIVGTTLKEILKKTDQVKVVFEDKPKRQILTMNFDGFLLETGGASLNKQVGAVKINEVLGFRTMSQVRTQGEDPHAYRQLLIQMEGSKEDYKLELLVAFKHYKLTAKKMVPKAKAKPA